MSLGEAAVLGLHLVVVASEGLGEGSFLLGEKLQEETGAAGQLNAEKRTCGERDGDSSQNPP